LNRKLPILIQRFVPSDFEPKQMEKDKKNTVCRERFLEGVVKRCNLVQSQILLAQRNGFKKDDTFADAFIRVLIFRYNQVGEIA
jgi:hypothetical protein